MGKKRLKRFFLYIGVLLVLVFTLLPIYLLFMATITPSGELNARTTHFIPSEVTFDNYTNLFAGEANSGGAPPFFLALKNSLIISLSTTVLSIAIGMFAAYSYARFRFKGKSQLLMSVLGLRMVPEIVLLIPLYVIFARAGMIDNVTTLIVIYTIFNLPFVIWLLQGFFSSISKDMEESALMDGASHPRFLFRFIVPLSAPGLIATAIFVFLISWDEFMFATIFTSTYEAKTLTVAISEFSQKGMVDFGLQITAGFLGSIPPIILALILQKYIISGLSEGSVKG